MNVFDFDKTIIRGDSTLAFLLFCCRKKPTLITKLPAILYRGIKFKLGLMEKQAFKESLFSAVFPCFDNIDVILENFWAANFSRVMPWYREIQKTDDVVISASPVDIVLPCCKRLGIKSVMGSPVNMKTGEYYGKNCHGEEKVIRFRKAFPDADIDAFYSDSHSDDPMAKLAKRAYMISGDKVTEWKF